MDRTVFSAGTFNNTHMAFYSHKHDTTPWPSRPVLWLWSRGLAVRPSDLNNAGRCHEMSYSTHMHWKLNQIFASPMVGRRLWWPSFIHAAVRSATVSWCTADDPIGSCTCVGKYPVLHHRTGVVQYSSITVLYHTTFNLKESGQGSISIFLPPRLCKRYRCYRFVFKFVG